MHFNVLFWFVMYFSPVFTGSLLTCGKNATGPITIHCTTASPQCYYKPTHYTKTHCRITHCDLFDARGATRCSSLTPVQCNSPTDLLYKTRAVITYKRKLQLLCLCSDVVKAITGSWVLLPAAVPPVPHCKGTTLGKSLTHIAKRL